MTNARKLRGRLSDPRHIELDEPVHDLTGPVDVVVSPAKRSVPRSARHGLLGLCADLGSAPSAAEIDQARRAMWATFQ